MTLSEKQQKTKRRLKNYLDQCQYNKVQKIAEQIEAETGLIIIER